MPTNEVQSGSPEIKAIVAGIGFGLVVGATLGIGLALMSGAFASGMGWFVVAHAAFAMMLMGGWMAPCFVQHDEVSVNHNKHQTRDKGSLPVQDVDDVTERNAA